VNLKLLTLLVRLEAFAGLLVLAWVILFWLGIRPY
jgi:hypothetical protein